MEEAQNGGENLSQKLAGIWAQNWGAGVAPDFDSRFGGIEATACSSLHAEKQPEVALKAPHFMLNWFHPVALLMTYWWYLSGDFPETHHAHSA